MLQSTFRIGVVVGGKWPKPLISWSFRHVLGGCTPGLRFCQSLHQPVLLSCPLQFYLQTISPTSLRFALTIQPCSSVPGAANLVLKVDSLPGFSHYP